MTEHEVSRTLVKSPPELWAELSDASSLARHLGQFGEIRITRLEPETAVAWEGESARGTVRLEPSGWGTKVILEASQVAVESPEVEKPVEVVVEPEEPAVVEPECESDSVAPEPEPVAVAPEPPVAPEPTVAPRRPGFFQRLFRSRGTRPAPEPPEPVPSPPEPEAVVSALEPEAIAPEPVITPPEPEPPTPEPTASQPPLDEALKAVLDSLGQAHHRPFSRA